MINSAMSDELNSDEIVLFNCAKRWDRMLNCLRSDRKHRYFNIEIYSYFYYQFHTYQIIPNLFIFQFFISFLFKFYFDTKKIPISIQILFSFLFQYCLAISSFILVKLDINNQQHHDFRNTSFQNFNRSY